MIKVVLFIINFCFFCTVAVANEEGVVSLFANDTNNGRQTDNSKNKESDFFSFMDLKIPSISFSSEEEKKENSPTINDVIKSADNGDLQSQLALGYAYLYGKDGLKVDYKKSFEYYSKAALQNDPVGLNNLGSLYYGGIGVERSAQKASVLFEKAAKLGNIDAAANIGFIYASGNGAQKDIQKALNYLEKAVDSDNPAAKFMVGYAYYKGIDRNADYMKAAELLKKAADKGFDEAQTLVAKLYIEGKGFAQNYNEAVKYLNEAVAQGNTEAMMLLGDIYEAGRIYNKNIFLAHVSYNLAAVRGVPTAVEKRNNVEAKMKIDEVLAAQKKAGIYQEKVSDVTSYIRQTYGKNIGSFFAK